MSRKPVCGRSATTRAERLATGIHVGLGSPWPGSEVSQPKRPRRTRIELSRLCMTRRITERSDQFRTESALVQVGSPDELAHEVSALLLDAGRRRSLGERARDLVDRNRGAVSRTTGALSSLLA